MGCELVSLPMTDQSCDQFHVIFFRISHARFSISVHYIKPRYSSKPVHGVCAAKVHLRVTVFLQFVRPSLADAVYALYGFTH